MPACLAALSGVRPPVRTVSVLLFLVLGANYCVAQPHPGDSALAWANWINQQTPQAVPQQTITIGTFRVAPGARGKMMWSAPLYACPGGSSGGVVALNPPVCLTLNSYDMRYQIEIAKPADYDLQVVLANPTVKGGREQIAGTLQEASASTPAIRSDHPLRPVGPSSIATVAFHPHLLTPQVLTFYHAGTPLQCDFDGQPLPCVFTLKPALQPQLGAFVVPRLPVTVIYQPAGCGECPTGTCGSNADYEIGSTVGTTLSWDYSVSSGTITTKSSSDVTNAFSALFKAISLVPGPTSAVASAASGVLGAVQGIYNVDQVSTQQSTSGTTESSGWALTLRQKFSTQACQKDDLFVYLQNVLFVYLVVPKDLVTGNITSSGAPTVVLMAIRYDPPIAQLTASELQTQLPAAEAQQFLAMDLQMNPASLNTAIRYAVPPAPIVPNSKNVVAGVHPSPQPPPMLNSPLKGRLSFVGQGLCPTASGSSFQEVSSKFSQSGTYHTDTNITTKNVTGFLASVLGQAGQTIQSASYSSNVSNWQTVESGSEINLQCPEYAPADAWTMNVYLDTMLGSLIAIPVGPWQPQADNAESSPQGIQGTAYDAQGQPAIHQQVVLRINGMKFHTITDSRGQFAFVSHGPMLPAGRGSLTVGRLNFPVTFNRSLLTLDLKPGVAASSAGPLNAANASQPGHTPQPAASNDGACCTIVSVNVATGVVLAEMKATAEKFQFQVTRQLAQSLSVGQAVYANFRTRQVSIDGRTASGTIVTGVRGTGPQAPRPR